MPGRQGTGSLELAGGDAPGACGLVLRAACPKPARWQTPCHPGYSYRKGLLSTLVLSHTRAANKAAAGNGIQGPHHVALGPLVTLCSWQ